MYQKLGPTGLVGVACVLLGIGVLSWRDPVVAAALMIILAGLALVVRALVSSVLGTFGLG